ncbi:hypothetical protein PoB_005777100 [Plakobranchus ocellatus]|uniref:Uncharacterized protein n=1 Tax=Plakobranchus ocellatus TaxID=259542 RepID=A0AAV4CER8_9GAST|nr:hypothetical protein PoB_005777100 [Plakobranchus ocellatus]
MDRISMCRLKSRIAEQRRVRCCDLLLNQEETDALSLRPDLTHFINGGSIDFLSKHVYIIDLLTIAVWVPAKNSPTGLSRVVRGDQGRLSPINW